MISFSSSPKIDFHSVGKFLKSFQESPLYNCSEESLQKALQMACDLKKEKGLLFIFAMGGMGTAGKIAGSSSLSNTVFHINSLDETNLYILNSLTKEQLKNAQWIFISKSGETAENTFYIQWIEKMYIQKKLKPKKGQVQLLTQKKESALGAAVKKLNGTLSGLKGNLPGRFSFFTESGLLQAHLTGLDIKQFSEGFIKGREPHNEIKKAFAFFLNLIKKRGGECFLFSDPSLLELIQWFEVSWAESLFKEKQVYPVKACTFSSLYHGRLEEISTKGKSAFVVGLNHLSSPKHSSFITRNNHAAFENLNHWKSERERVLKILLKKKEVSFLFLNFTMNRNFLLGYLIALFFQVIYGIGTSLKVNIYTQPQVDRYKKLFYN